MKCKFGETRVVYIGHTFTGEGVEPDLSKMEAIVDMPEPQDEKGIQRLLGIVNYVAKFVPVVRQHGCGRTVKNKKYFQTSKSFQALYQSLDPVQTILDKSGFEAKHIMAISGRKNESNIWSYSKTDLPTKEECRKRFRPSKLSKVSVRKYFRITKNSHLLF